MPPKPRFIAIAIVLARIAVDPLAAGSQVPITRWISDSIACTSCRIIEEKIGELSGANLSRFGPIPDRVLTDSLHRYWMVGSGHAAVFDSTGRFLTFAANNAASMPFNDVADAIAIDRDSVLLLDVGDRQAAVIGPDLTVKRLIGYPYTLRRGVILKWPQYVLLSGDIATEEDIGWPLHLAAFGGSLTSIIRSFGPDSGAFLPGDAGIHTQSFASVGARAWTADLGRYRLTLWDTTGKLLDVLERESAQYAFSRRPTIGNDRTPPTTVITDLVTDSTGLLWVFMRVAASRWRSAWPPLPPYPVDIPATKIHTERLFNTAVEVIDPRSARLMSRARFDDWIVGVGSGGRVVSYSVDSAGAGHFTIKKLQLSGR